jgi:hypothetical protein
MRVSLVIVVMMLDVARSGRDCRDRGGASCLFAVRYVNTLFRKKVATIDLRSGSHLSSLALKASDSLLSPLSSHLGDYRYC